MDIKTLTRAICPGCDTKLPDFKREGSNWGIVDCQKCSKWFDVFRYVQAGGVSA